MAAEAAAGPAGPVVVKWGGAAITRKGARAEALDEGVLGACVAQLAAAWGARGPGGLVLVHGAGCFGHWQAKEARVHEGWQGAGRLGFARTRAAVTRLNSLVVSRLVAAGVPAVGLPAFPSCTTRGPGRLAGSAAAPVGAAAAALGAGLLPVLHGDAVLDERQGCAILSGDLLVRELALGLGARHAVFLTNVPGLFDRPPADSRAEPIREVVVGGAGGGWAWRGADGRLREGAEARMAAGAAPDDVTGGVAAKVREAAGAAEGGVPVLIAQAGSPAGEQAVLHGTAALRDGGWAGTLIVHWTPSSGSILDSADDTAPRAQHRQ